MPQSYVKVKGIEKKVFMEHKRNVDMNELDAKVLYTKNARALKTYGVTFFLVKVIINGVAISIIMLMHFIGYLGKNEG